uniref:Immunoglobulin domain-containing protein n=1 Tax=Oreochromis niloticus TaxID=8128 RepID=A0A669C2P5_ORENI
SITVIVTFETKTVYVGENINLTCPRTDVGTLFWIKLVSGDFPKILGRSFSSQSYGQEIFKSRFQTHYDKKFSNLTILKAVQDDEGIYHCGMIEWINPEWTGTYLLVKGKLVIHCHTFIHFKVFQCFLESSIISCLVFFFFLEQKSGSEFTVLVMAIIFLVISVTLIIVCCQTPRGICEQCKGKCCSW